MEGQMNKKREHKAMAIVIAIFAVLAFMAWWTGNVWWLFPIKVLGGPPW
jgi:hypothetical protein